MCRRARASSSLIVFASSPPAGSSTNSFAIVTQRRFSSSAYRARFRYNSYWHSNSIMRSQYGRSACRTRSSWRTHTSGRHSTVTPPCVYRHGSSVANAAWRATSRSPARCGGRSRARSAAARRNRWITAGRKYRAYQVSDSVRRPVADQVSTARTPNVNTCPFAATVIGPAISRYSTTSSSGGDSTSPSAAACNLRQAGSR